MFVLLVFALLLLPATQQPATPVTPQMGTPKAAADDKSQKCVIEGKVVSMVDGQPLKKTAVTLFPQQQPGTMTRPLATTTDADGKFVFREVDAGRYTMNFYRVGYARTNYGARAPNGPGTTLTLLPGQLLKDIHARLIPAGAINGKLIDEDNDPVANAYVQLQRWGYTNGKRQLIPFGGASTDDRGQFRIFGIAPGRYFVSARYEGVNYFNVQTDSSRDTEETYAPTYYPGVFDVAQASAMEVKSGDEIMGIVFRLARAKAVRITGTVHGPDGPMKNAMVQVFPRGTTFFGGMMNMRSTDDKGAFTLTGVMPGSYAIVVRGSMQDQQLIGRTDIDVAGSPIDNVTVDATPGASLDADVRLDGNVDLSKTTTRLFLSSVEMMPVPGSATQIKEAGSVTLNKVYDGNYFVRVSPLPDDAYLSKAVYDDKDVLADGIRVHGAPAHLALTVSANGAHLEGTVQDKDHQPFTGAFIALVPEETQRSRQDLFKTATSDQYGHFTLRGIPPGKYKLFAWDSIDQGAYMDPDFLKAYDDQGKTMELSPGEKSSPELRVIITKTGS